MEPLRWNLILIRILRIQDENLTRTHHLYYQWVCLVLLAQCISFYVPRYLWRLSENGLTKKLMSGEAPALARYLMSHQDCHTFLGFTYHACEVMNVLVLCGNFILTDLLLNQKFRGLGLFVLNGGDLARIFPRMGKCTFQMFGPTGEIERHDSLCLLAQNVFNEKIFFALWFWYLFLGVLTIMNMFYTLTLFFCMEARVHRISFVCPSLASSKTRIDREKRLETVVRELHYGEFFVLRLLSKNVPAQFLPKLINICYDLMVERRKDFGYKFQMRNDLYSNREDESRFLLAKP
ncbi:innexin inx2 [Galendromus occidentalis]|uniref:Innexin n=1 Tax=Galendromus occidentalis TaxID=34638 RepID=A0AAJ7P9P3_9ACAR|nr:innexin inx2 [Galendromus occidentalis]